jgi:hypothetical protein
MFIINISNELKGKIIDDIWDTITDIPSWDIIDRIEVVEDKTQNIHREGEITAISNIYILITPHGEMQKMLYIIKHQQWSKEVIMDLWGYRNVWNTKQ